MLPSSRSKRKPKKQQAINYAPTRAGCLTGCLSGFFEAKNGGYVLLRNIRKFLLDYTASHPRKQYSSLVNFINFLEPFSRISKAGKFSKSCNNVPSPVLNVDVKVNEDITQYELHSYYRHVCTDMFRNPREENITNSVLKGETKLNEAKIDTFFQ